MKPDPRLVARLLSELRRRSQPVSGARLAQRFGISRLRSIGEAATAARGLGVSYIPGRGYVLAKTQAERVACAERMRRAARSALRAAAALERGRSRNCQIPATRRRAAGLAGEGAGR